jgi:hypothetical protein
MFLAEYSMAGPGWRAAISLMGKSQLLKLDLTPVWFNQTLVAQLTCNLDRWLEFPRTFQQLAISSAAYRALECDSAEPSLFISAIEERRFNWFHW